MDRDQIIRQLLLLTAPGKENKEAIADLVLRYRGLFIEALRRLD